MILEIAVPTSTRLRSAYNLSKAPLSELSEHFQRPETHTNSRLFRKTPCSSPHLALLDISTTAHFGTSKVSWAQVCLHLFGFRDAALTTYGCRQWLIMTTYLGTQVRDIKLDLFSYVVVLNTFHRSLILLCLHLARCHYVTPSIAIPCSLSCHFFLVH
jgi:hypothetical protein